MTYLASATPMTSADAWCIFAFFGGIALVPVGIATAIWILSKAGYEVRFGGRF